MTFTFFCEVKLKENSKYIFFINLVISDSIFLFIVDVSSILFIFRASFNVGGCSFYINFYRGLFNNGVACISLMAIERFVAICHPLRYHNIFNQKSTLRCLGIIWFISFFFPVVEIIFMVTTDNLAFQREIVACEEVNNSIFEKNYVIIEYIRNCVFVLFFSGSFVILVSTYVLVVKVAKQAASRESEASKAKQTLRLHALQLILYMSAFLIQPFQTLADLTVNDSDVRYMLKTFFYFVCLSARFFSPFIYGLRDKDVRRYLRRRVCCGQNVLKVNPEHTISHEHA
uniref:LOW QUALITY PROTEIN: odorant receptor 131-2-like n=1 Tax=Petromyzon marinus TaxID=7757 RepID=A0AAJ7XFC2_PETMA|nr:LOW QUALITY PROTEIN: odorant receptor 131-2-like [Petromyzon marinus]